MKRWHKIVLTLVILLGAAAYWLLYDNRPGDIPAEKLDIAELRAAANSMAGAKPQDIAVETVARGALADTMLVAGGGFGKRDQGVNSFRIGRGAGNIIFDTGLNAKSNEAMPFYKFNAEAFARAQAALPAAAQILVSHEHLDHIGGLLTSPQWSTISARSHISRAQFDHPEITNPVVWPEGSRDSYRPMDYDRMQAVAPGVVLIKAASHTPGSQLLFVQLADGREYLFMGDISSMDRNWRETRARSRLVGDLLVGENRDAVFAWLKAFKAIHASNPGLIMVPSHDAVTIDELVASGALTRGF
jgi:glyoxylase-like metal-dependent hydrolase (beta-lactamase superfamily II)